MNKANRMRNIAAIILLFTFFATGISAILSQSVAQADGDESIVASGTIEGENTVIAAETGGRITAIYADEGDSVSAGDVLIELDASLLDSQLSELNAGIETAKANLAAVRDNPCPEAVAVAEAKLSQAETQRDTAYQLWQAMLPLLENPQELMVPISELQAQIKQAEGQEDMAQATLKTAQIHEDAASRDQSSHAALVGYQIAQIQTAAADVGTQLAHAQTQMLRVQLAHLWEQYNNPVALQVQVNQAEAGYHVASAAVSVAEANLNAVKKPTSAEEIAVAEAQLRVAESALALVDAQRAQLTLTAPRAGIISARVVDVGELAVPGATLLKLTDLNQVTLRVFIPETQIGRVSLGQSAAVTVDSLEQAFMGKVTYIADTAEFTPKNIQTKEERVNLVFAVEITIDNPDHLLKAGMPADAEILP